MNLVGVVISIHWLSVYSLLKATYTSTIQQTNCYVLHISFVIDMTSKCYILEYILLVF